MPFNNNKTTWKPIQVVFTDLGPSIIINLIVNTNLHLHFLS
jgi:hypothetical protein